MGTLAIVGLVVIPAILVHPALQVILVIPVFPGQVVTRDIRAHLVHLGIVDILGPVVHLVIQDIAVIQELVGIQVTLVTLEFQVIQGTLVLQE